MKLNTINEINDLTSSDSFEPTLKVSTSKSMGIDNIDPAISESSSAFKTDSEIDSTKNTDKLNSKIKGRIFRDFKANTALILPHSFKGKPVAFGL